MVYGPSIGTGYGRLRSCRAKVDDRFANLPVGSLLMPLSWGRQGSGIWQFKVAGPNALILSLNLLTHSLNSLAAPSRDFPRTSANSQCATAFAIANQKHPSILFVRASEASEVQTCEKTFDREQHLRQHPTR